jgi:hypothetical protein
VAMMMSVSFLLVCDESGSSSNLGYGGSGLDEKACSRFNRNKIVSITSRLPTAVPCFYLLLFAPSSAFSILYYLFINEKLFDEKERPTSPFHLGQKASHGQNTLLQLLVRY